MMARRMMRKHHVRCRGGGKGGDYFKALPIAMISGAVYKRGPGKHQFP